MFKLHITHGILMSLAAFLAGIRALRETRQRWRIAYGAAALLAAFNVLFMVQGRTGHVVLAALLHAAWNAMVKGGHDKNVGMTAVILGNVPPALVVIALMPTPDLNCLPYLIGGSVLHFGYQIFLLRAYSLGDFTQVYPIARGAAPMLVAVISVVVLGIDLLPMQLLAITAIGAGIASLCLVRSTTGQRNSAAAAVALVTACFIAGYSLVDGYGARVAGTALGFYAWIAIANAAVLTLYMAIRMPGVLQRVGTEGRNTALWGAGYRWSDHEMTAFHMPLRSEIAFELELRLTSARMRIVELVVSTTLPKGNLPTPNRIVR